MSKTNIGVATNPEALKRVADNRFVVVAGDVAIAAKPQKGPKRRAKKRRTKGK